MSKTVPVERSFQESCTRTHVATIAVGIHLIPAFVLLTVVAASFRWEWIGAVAFIGLAVLYAVTMSRGRLDWMLLISGPLAIVGALFVWSWFHHGELHAS
jgi:hypothetical protein